jgi:hypothetical protein
VRQAAQGAYTPAAEDGLYLCHCEQVASQSSAVGICMLVQPLSATGSPTAVRVVILFLANMIYALDTAHLV